MTLYAWARRRQFTALPAAEAQRFRVAEDAEVLAHCHWQTEASARLTLLLLHGLEGSSDAHYIRGLAAKGWAAGFNIVRLNQRNCGGTEHLSRGLYHSGLTADPVAVMTQLEEARGISRFALVGYSLGGNLVLKLAGEAGAAAAGRLVAVCAVSPVLELEACVRAIERRANFAYHWNFVRNLKRRMRLKARLFPGEWDLQPLRGLRTIRAFDEAYTAPQHGFAGASDYYHRASAMRVIDRLAVPALIISAEDDPFVPAEIFRNRSITGNPHITTVITRHGGHCAFVGPRGERDDGYWAESQVVSFVVNQMVGHGSTENTAAARRFPETTGR